MIAKSELSQWKLNECRNVYKAKNKWHRFYTMHNKSDLFPTKTA